MTNKNLKEVKVKMKTYIDFFGDRLLDSILAELKIITRQLRSLNNGNLKCIKYKHRLKRVVKGRHWRKNRRTKIYNHFKDYYKCYAWNKQTK